MSAAVARRYRFSAKHHVSGLGERWAEPHGHDYTVEVVAEGLIAPVVVDTDLMDDAWEPIGLRIDGTDLNESVGGPTTVEDLAATFLRAMPGFVREVTVWEDDDRWGRARR